MSKFSTKNPHSHIYIYSDIFKMIQTICQKGMLEILNGNVLFQLSFHICTCYMETNFSSILDFYGKVMLRAERKKNIHTQSNRTHARAHENKLVIFGKLIMIVSIRCWYVKTFDGN